MRHSVLLVLLLTALAWASPPPLEIARFTAMGSGVPNSPALDSVTGTLVVRNVSRHTVSGVVLLVHVADRNGNPLTTLRKPVGTLGPGKSARFEWSWYNYTLISVRPEAEVVYHVRGGVASISGHASYAAPATVTQKSPPNATPTATPRGYGVPNTTPERPAPGYGTP
ncbi:MAG: FxLYD domain-containing protein [Candidatus Xenobia bacterium]